MECKEWDRLKVRLESTTLATNTVGTLDDNGQVESHREALQVLESLPSGRPEEDQGITAAGQGATEAAQGAMEAAQGAMEDSLGTTEVVIQVSTQQDLTGPHCLANQLTEEHILQVRPKQEVTLEALVQHRVDTHNDQGSSQLEQLLEDPKQELA